jgi:SAM-dependent methyltransferase
MPQVKCRPVARNNTHETVILDRKPDELVVRRMVHDYFETEAASYDRFNRSTDTRRRFIATMNDLIAHDLRAHEPIEVLLSVACGTGFREGEIRAASGLRFAVVGVDSSPAMCARARRAGLETIESAWLDADLGHRQFDAAVYLYSLGLAPTRSARVMDLSRIATHLKPGAPFYCDVHNLADRNEWGPELRRLFVDRHLASKGYELGDTFYRRIGSEQLAFFHYFEQSEAEELLTEAGFRVTARHYIDCGLNVGDLVGPDEGAILFTNVRI